MRYLITILLVNGNGDVCSNRDSPIVNSAVNPRQTVKQMAIFAT